MGARGMGRSRRYPRAAAAAAAAAFACAIGRGGRLRGDLKIRMFLLLFSGVIGMV